MTHIRISLQIREDDEEADTDGANYQLEMMRCLREVNVDNNTIGWYAMLFHFHVVPYRYSIHS